MFIVGVVCMCVASAAAIFGLRSLSPTHTADPTGLLRRAMAPTQLAAAVMLAAGGVAALAAPPHPALVVVIVCIVGALSTLAVGSWQSARYTLRREAARVKAAECSGDCAMCPLSCH